MACDSPLTRRAFLRRGAAATALGAGAARLPLDALARTPSARAPTPMRKLVSLGGSTALLPGGVHDYRFWGNREDVRATGTTWVKIWLGWEDVQGAYHRPATRAESWQQLNAGVPGAPAPDALGLRVIDEQVRAANEDGVAVLLCVATGYPEWARPDPGQAPPAGLVASQQLPAEVGAESPFGWFVAHLCARYKAGAPANPSGPREPGLGELTVIGPEPRYGNPSGAHVEGIEVCNEPNLMAWPQEVAARRVAEMMRTAEHWSARLGGPAVLGPGTSDTDGRHKGSEFLGFTHAVLEALRGWRPRANVGWSHHNYKDMAEGTAQRLAAVRDALEEAGWRDRLIWLTEGGYDATPHGGPQTLVPPAAREEQAGVLERGWRAAADFSAAAERAGRIGLVHTFAQHVVHDQGTPTNTFKSGLRDDFRFEPPTPGERRPAWYVWRDLPGSDVP